MSALQRWAAALRPGGVLAAVAPPRLDLPREAPVELAAIAWHHAVGLGLAVSRGRRADRLRRRPEHAAMPVRSPELTTREVRRQAEAVLPGVRVRRLLLWRYLLVWQRPVTAPPPAAGSPAG